MKTIKVAILGAGGRMGCTLVRCGIRTEGIKVVAAIEQAGHETIGRDAGEVAGVSPIGLKVTDSFEAASDADVVIDFTSHTAAPANVKRFADMRRAMVIGATGLNEKETGAIRIGAMKVPIVCAPNMSLGVNLLFAMVTKAAQVLGDGYRVEIDETHHVHKKDAPSGTALKLGEKVAEARGEDFQSMMVHIEGEAKADAPADKMIIRSHRRGEVIGDHTVSFENQGERVELTHHASSRDAFAMGALLAAQWVVSRKPGLYDMQAVLGL